MSDRFDHLAIAADDFDKSLAFYRDVLNWRVVDEWPDHGAGRGAVLTGGGIRLVLSERNAAGSEPTPTPRLHLDIHDIDARFREMPPGAHVLRRPEQTQWGTRWFVVKDPDGNVIAFEELHARGA